MLAVPAEYIVLPYICRNRSGGTFVSSMILHWLEDASSYLQSILSALVNGIRKATKAWFDAFIVHAKTKHELRTYLEKHFSIIEKYEVVVSAKNSSSSNKKSDDVGGKITANDLKWFCKTCKR